MTSNMTLTTYGCDNSANFSTKQRAKIRIADILETVVEIVANIREMAVCLDENLSGHPYANYIDNLLPNVRFMQRPRVHHLAIHKALLVVHSL